MMVSHRTPPWPVRPDQAGAGADDALSRLAARWGNVITSERENANPVALADGDAEHGSTMVHAARMRMGIPFAESQSALGCPASDAVYLEHPSDQPWLARVVVRGADGVAEL